MVDLETKTVVVGKNKDSSEKKVVMRQLTAVDEIASIDILGKDVDPENLGAFALKQFQVQLALSVVVVDGEKVAAPRKMSDVVELMSKFKKSEWQKLSIAFNELNNEVEDDGEQKENFTNE